MTHFEINSGSVRLLPQYLEYVEFIPLFVCCTSVSRNMILILLRFSIRKVRILTLILFSIPLFVSRILCVCSPLRLLRYYLVHLTLIPSAFLGAGQSRQHFNAISYNITGSCCEMLLRSWPNARNTLQHLILFDIVTFLYDTTDFNLSSLPLLPNVSTVRTLNLLLSSIAALVFRALWFNPTLIVNMYRTHFEFNSHLVSCVSFSSLRVKLVLRLLI